MSPTSGTRATIIVPTFNERDNVGPLVRGINDVFRETPADSVEIFFVDDSDDGTPEAVRQAGKTSRLPVRLLHREGRTRTGGLSGAVAAALCCTSSDRVVVMDGDLQHPPSLAPQLLNELDDADLVVASRYCGGGGASGLSSTFRRAVSAGSVLLARACFPRRIGRACTDPMTGFFAFRREAVDVQRLRPRGFKILLEILARHELTVREVPFLFGDRLSGHSKASWSNGTAYLRQLMSLRMGRMSRFAVVGAFGALVNLAVMSAFLLLGDSHYLMAALVAAELTIVQNFVLQELWVFADLREGGRSLLARAGASIAYNNVDALLRLPLLFLLVDAASVAPVAAQALTLAAAFLARFVFVSTVVYRASTSLAPAPVTTPTVPTEHLAGTLVNRGVG